MLGMVYEALGRRDESARLFETALTLDPLFPGWHAQLSNVRQATGRLQEAEAEQRKVLQISPTAATAHYALGLILLAQGKFQGALAEMQREQPDSGRNVGLSMVYHGMGRRAESHAALATEVRDTHMTTPGGLPPLTPTVGNQTRRLRGLIVLTFKRTRGCTGSRAISYQES